MDQFVIDLDTKPWIKILHWREADVENKKAPTNGRGSIYPRIQHRFIRALLRRQQRPLIHPIPTDLQFSF